MVKKLIFLDVDGTLVDYENRLPQSAAEAIQKARKNGHLVYIVTGRSKAEVYQNIWDIGIDGMIGGNGSYVEDHDTVIMHRHLSKTQCREAVDWLKMKNLEFYLESNNGLFASEHFKEEGNPVIQQYAKQKGEVFDPDMSVERAFPDMIYGEKLYRDDINKISFILKTYQDFTDAKAQFPHLHVGTWGGKGELALFGDLALKDINKASAIKVLLEYLHADRKNTIAFGDAKVDIPMLEFCNFGVAMGSGGSEIKEIADYVTDGVEQDGLYHAFQYLNLI